MKHPSQLAVNVELSPQAKSALKDAWFFFTVSGAALLLALPLYIYLRGQIAQDDPISLMAVMLGSGSVACLLYAALKFLRAYRHGDSSSIGPLMLAGTVSVAGLAVMVGNSFADNLALQAGAIALPVAGGIGLLCVWPIRRLKGLPLRMTLVLALPLVLPLFLIVATLYEFNRRTFNPYFRDKGYFWAEMVPNVARPLMASGARLVKDNADIELCQRDWMTVPMLRDLLRTNKFPPACHVAWERLVHKDSEAALALALEIPKTAAPWIPITSYDQAAGLEIGRNGTKEDVIARLTLRYSHELVNGVAWGIENARRTEMFVEVVAEQIEAGRATHAFIALISSAPDVKARLLRKHLVSTTPLSKVIVAAFAGFSHLGSHDDIFELALFSDDINARKLALNCMNVDRTLTIRQWERVFAIAKGKASNGTVYERRIAAFRVADYFKIAHPKYYWESTPITAKEDAEVDALIDTAREKLAKTKE